MTTQGSLPTSAHSQHLVMNNGLSSNNNSPETIQGNILMPNDNGRRTSLQSSPVHLATSLNNLSLSSNMEQQQQESQQQQPIHTVRLRNLPSDLTLREAYCIFALAKDFVGLDLVPDSNSMPTIFARFKSLSSASACSQMLESTYVFGPGYPYYVSAEIMDTSIQPTLSLGASAKRPSIGNQRSRFLFSDPFNNEAIAENMEAPSTANSNGVGKSLLLMESQQDAREYDQLVRDPWSQAPPVSARQTSTSASFSGPANPSFAQSQPQTPGVEWDRRRQSSAFFNNQSPLLQTQLSSNQVPTQLSLNQSTPQMGSSQPLGQQPPQPLPMNQALAIPPQSAQQSTPLPQLVTNQSFQNSMSQPPSAVQQTPQTLQPPSSQQSMTSSQQSSQVDLSILARVPPPANPADQNPPCNTLYVGNLPPDATEAELRQLFSPQRGFRRLSFRTKQPNGNTPGGSSHSHGPMCFVEFEDVAHATRALAELYGRTLPRPGGIPGKGGIRLSFSKNPLGVRGPGQRRTSGFSYQPGFKN